MQITKHIHALKIPFQLTISPTAKISRFVYVYLIYGRQIYLIDTGVDSSESLILDYIKNTGRKAEDISMVIQTHSHPDHIGATHTIKELSDCLVASHPDAKSWIEDVELQFKERPVPGFHSLVGGSVGVERILEDGCVLDLDDGLGLEVLYTPGHSKGSISLLLREDSALFSGDTIPLAGSIPVYEDVLASVRSIKKLRSIKGISVLLSSWDDPRKGDEVYELMDNSLRYFQHIHDVVMENSRYDPEADSRELCRKAIDALGLPGIAANPLVARSIEANLKVIDRQKIF